MHAGGRGLGGGIKKAQTPEKVEETAKEMIGKKLVTPQTGKEGKVIHQILLEEGCSIAKEFYLAVLLDRTEQSLSIIASSEGGVFY